MALIVVAVETFTGPVYNVPVVDVGVLPSVVYLMDADTVADESVTVCAPTYVPPGGLKDGAFTGVDSDPPLPHPV